MPTENTPEENKQNSGENTPENNTQPEDSGKKYTVEELTKMLDDARKEAAKHRREARDAQQKLSTIETESLQKSGQWEELAKRTASELETLKPYKQRLEQVEERITTSNKKRIEQIPEAMRDLIPENYDALMLADWLDRNEAKLRKPVAPNLNPGSSGALGAPVQLTPEQLTAAAKLGLPPEEYAKGIRK